jgi:hypothetical protein
MIVSISFSLNLSINPSVICILIDLEGFKGLIANRLIIILQNGGGWNLLSQFIQTKKNC